MTTLTDTRSRIDPGTDADASAVHELRAELDEAADIINRGAVEAGMERLMRRLDVCQRRLGRDTWRAVARTTIDSHPLLALVHESPFARRAFHKPRGYAGDADTLDLVYRCAPLPPGISARGRRVSECELETETCRGIRARLALMTEAIDETAAQRRNPRILSVACGHLREAQRARAMADGAVGELIAFDNDADSLGLVAKEQPAVTTTHGSVRQIVGGAARWSDLDLIYSSGLYDYLSQRFAQVLTRTLFAMLKPRGRLLIANMTPEANAAYLEAFLDWWMTYRCEGDMRDLLAEIPPADVAWSRTFRQPGSHVVFLEIIKA